MCKDREREENRMREHHSNFISSKELGEWREDEGQVKYYCGEIIGNTSLDGKLFRDRTRSSQIRWTQWPAPAPCLLDHQTLASTLKYTGTEEVKRCRRKGENYHFKMVGKGFDLIQIFANRESIKLDRWKWIKIATMKPYSGVLEQNLGRWVCGKSRGSIQSINFFLASKRVLN